MSKGNGFLRLRIFWEMYAQSLLKAMETRSAMPPRELPAEGFMEVETFFGRRMKVLASECVSTEIAERGCFEPGLCAMLIHFLKPGMVVFDIGAHYGFHSLLASRLVGHQGRVHAFEPTQATWNVLRENIREADNIQAHNFAFWSSASTRLFWEHEAAYSAFNSFFDPRLSPSERAGIRADKAIVATKTVDQFVQDQGVRPDLIKIDAESAELEILKGMDRVIAEHRPMITLEVGDKDIPGVCSTRDLIQYLCAKGYKPFECRDGKIVGHLLRDHYPYDNLLFLPDVTTRAKTK